MAVSAGNVGNNPIKVEANDLPSGVKRKHEEDDYDALE
jgi:hypothetical protein